MSHRPPRSQPHAAAALPVVERLTRTVTAETEDIVAGRPAPYELYGQRKNQGLIELNRLLPAFAKAGGGEGLGAALAELNAALAANKRALGMQLKAAIAVVRHHRPRHPRGPVGRHLHRTGVAPERGMIRSLLVAVVALAAALGGGGSARIRPSFTTQQRAAAAVVRTTEIAQDPRNQRAAHQGWRGQGLRRPDPQLHRRHGRAEDGGDGPRRDSGRRGVPLRLRRRHDRLRPPRPVRLCDNDARRWCARSMPG